MGKMRVRTKNRKKGIRWAKGQSSSSNPEKTRHRDAARTRTLLGGALSRPHFDDADTGPSRLTEETLLRHDALLGNNPTGAIRDDLDVDLDGVSAADTGVTGKTFESFASNWSNCDNVSFKKLCMKFDKNKPGQWQMLAVLAAVTDAIRENKATDDDATYFEYLLESLEATIVREQTEDQRPVLALICMVIKRVSPDQLQRVFPKVSKMFYDLLSKQIASNETEPYICKCLIGCLSIVLRAQSYRTWTEESTKRIYKGLLSLCIHPKPKVRRAAQRSVCNMLAHSLVTEAVKDNFEGDNDDFFHPAAKLTAEECLRRLEVGQEVNATLHTMVLLKEVLQYAPKAQVEKVCKATWSLMQGKTHPHMTICGLRLFHGLFSARPPQTVLTWELNAKLINALYDHRPSVNDPGPSVAWLTVMQEALINLGHLDQPQVTLKNMVKFFGEAKRGWASDKKAVYVATTAAMRAILGECLAPKAEEYAKEGRADLDKLISHVVDGLGYQYHAAWGQVLIVISDLFAAAGQSSGEQLCKYLPLLAERRAGENFLFVNQLDYAVGKAIRVFGAPAVLSAIPLSITGDDGETLDFPRSWLLPVLRENVQRTQLAYFVENFLPLTEKLRDAANRCINRSNDVGKKMYQLLENQVWALLPSFCNCPTDLASAIMMRVGNMRFAQVLGETLKKRTDVVRSHVLAALRQLVTKSKLTGKPEDVTAVAKRAQNFLPLLCKIYATRPSGSEETNLRSAVYATLVEYAAVAPEKDIREMFAAGLNNYQNEDAFVRDATMDILKAYLPYQDEDNLRLMYKEAVRQIESDDHRVQKKAYRILEELCRCERPVCVKFVRNLISLPASEQESLRRIFLKSLSKASPSSQPPRLNCLISIVSMLGRCDDESGEYMNFVREVLPEAVLCIRAVNVKARRASVELVKTVGTAMINWNKSDDSDDQDDGDDEDEGMNKGSDNSKAVSDLIDILAAGLAGEATVIKCTLLALATVLYEFSDSVPDATMERLLENVSALATCSSREVVGSCLSFVVVFIQVNPVFKTGRKDILERLVGVVVNMNEDCLRHHRMQVTKVLTRLVRKFGYELVCGMVPKDDEIMHKRLKNIHKEQVRKKRNEEKKLSERDDDEDDDDDGFDEAVKRKSLKAKTMDEIIDAEDSDDELMDDDDDISDRKSKKKKKSQRQTFIVENEDKETIVDFLDSKAASQVTSMKPQSIQKMDVQAKAKKDKNGGFDLAPDGRLLIKDDSDDSDSDVDEKDAKSDDDDDENTFQSLVTSSSNRKRKRGTSVASGATGRSGMSMASGRAMKYQAGGSGIHRPVNKKWESASNAPGSEYRSTKAAGDVKRKGKPDPYAYVPLQKSSLNKRKRQKFEGQFKNIVKSAKKGAAAGAKNKAISGRMRKLSL